MIEYALCSKSTYISIKIVKHFPVCFICPQILFNFLIVNNQKGRLINLIDKTSKILTIIVSYGLFNFLRNSVLCFNNSMFYDLIKNLNKKVADK